MQMQAIGVIHTPFKEKKDCPIQPVYAEESRGEIEIFKEFEEGLKDIETFTHLYLLYRFDRAGEVRLIRPTFLDDEPHGVFASRHPCRPNGIGMSIVTLEKRENNFLKVSGVDMLDNTPLLDIKPYVRRFDSIPTASNGWVETREWREKPKNSE